MREEPLDTTGGSAGLFRTDERIDTDDDFEAWVAPHLGAMRYLALRLAGADAADDAVQDALTRAWRHWADFDPSKGSPKAWLLRIVANESRRGWRRWSRVPHALDWAAEDVGSGDTSTRGGAPAAITGDAAGAASRIDVERAIAALPQRQRLAVDLHYFVDLRVEDCAIVMDCAPGTVKWLLHEARERLRPVLADESPDQDDVGGQDEARSIRGVER